MNMTRTQRKRNAAVAAMAILDWRDRMARENTERVNAELEIMARYEIMLQQMQAEAERFRKLRIEHRAICTLVTAMVRGDGAAGAIE